MAPITLAEQVAAVEHERAMRARALQWRAGRKGFSVAVHNEQMDRLDAAIATLRALAAAPAGEAKADV